MISNVFVIKEKNNEIDIKTFENEKFLLRENRVKDGKRKSQSVFCKWVNDKPYIQREKSDIEIIQSRLMIFDSASLRRISQARLNNFRYSTLPHPIFVYYHPPVSKRLCRIFLDIRYRILDACSPFR